MDQQTIDLLKGLGSSAGVGAGIGAVGMGAANLLSPEEHKKRSLLKSMLLGGALGGVTGGGMRAAKDYLDPEASHDPSAGLGDLFNPASTPKPTEQKGMIHSGLDWVGGNPFASTVGGGVGLPTLTYLNRKGVDLNRMREKIKEKAEEVMKQNKINAELAANNPRFKYVEKLPPKPHWYSEYAGQTGDFKFKNYPTKTLSFTGLLGAGLGYGLSSGLHEYGLQDERYNDANNLNAVRENAANLK
jgi:hypothetical protein